MSKKRKNDNAMMPEIMIEPTEMPKEEPVVEVKEEIPVPVETPKEAPVTPVIESKPVKEEEKRPVYVATPESPYIPALEVCALIKETMSKAPKRNDGTTMPTPVSLRCSTGDMYFIMYQFDAVTVENLWNRVKNKVTPEEFVSYLYTTMGLTPPKLYLYRKDIAIA